MSSDGERLEISAVCADYFAALHGCDAERFRGMFHPRGVLLGLGPDDEPELIFGPQGGHHLTMAVQASGLGPPPAPASLSLEARAIDATGQERRVGGFTHTLDDRRDAGDEQDATWQNLVLIVEPWNLSEVRILSARIEQTVCERSADWTLTLPALPL